MQELHSHAQGELSIHEVLKGLEFGVAKPTSISPLRIHSTAQYRPLRGEATVGVYELV